MDWNAVVWALLQAASVAGEPQDPDRLPYPVADLKALREANVFSPTKSRASSSRREDRRPESRSAEPVVARPKPLVVTGFVLDPATKTPRAIIEDRNEEKFRRLKEPLFAKGGEEAAGWTLEDVTSEQVTVVQGEIRKTLRVGESFPESTSPEAAPAPEGSTPAVPALETKPLQEGEKNDILERLRQKNKKKRSEDEPQ